VTGAAEEVTAEQPTAEPAVTKKSNKQAIGWIVALAILAIGGGLATFFIIKKRKAI
jgi:uncharacterized protein HemX